MKFSILQENLKTALTYLQKAVPTKPQLPILSSILLQANEHSLVLAATDLYFGVRCTAPAKTITPGTIAIPGDIFKQLISSLPAGEIECTLSETQLIIKTTKTTSKIPVQDGSEFPQFPEVEGKEVEFTIGDLNEFDKNVAFSISLDQTRPVLTTLSFMFSSTGLEVAATDGFRLALLQKQTHSSEDQTQLLLPAKALNEAVRIANQLKAATISMVISLELKQIKICVENTELFVRLVEGEYPPYTRIIPDSFVLEVVIDAEEFMSQLKRAVLFARDSSNIVRLKILKDSGLEIIARSPAYGEFLSQMTYEGEVKEETEVAFNIHYLIDFIANTKAEQIKISVNESLRPVQLSIPGVTSYRYIIMPFRTNDSS